MTRVSVLPAVLPKSWLVVIVGGVVASVSACNACSKDSPASATDAADAGGAAVSSDDDGDGDGDGAGDAVDASSRLARMTEERAEEARRDASAGADAAVPAECEGKALRLIESVLDPRCGVTTAEWRFLSDAAVDGGGGGGVKQEAHVVEGQEGSRSAQVVVLSLVNRGATAAIVPLRFNPEHPELAVSVIAEDAKHALFELAAPSFEIPAAAGVAGVGGDAGVGVGKRPVRHSTLVAIDAGIEKAAGLHVRSARIRLLANGGTASVRVTIDPTVTRRVDRSCPATPADAAAASGGSGGSDCAPARLPSKAKYTLHIGQLITGIDVGLPARVDWVVP